MSTATGKTRRGPPKHQNKFAWDPNAFKKINQTEVGGKLRPYSDVTGVCPRCRDQIQWKRKYGKYKQLIEPAKCQRCSKRNVRQAYHNLCTSCAKEHHVCAKCSCQVDHLVGRDLLEVEAEKKALDDAIKNSRERDRRTLLRMLNKGKSKGEPESQLDTRSKAGDLFSAKTISQYVTGDKGKDEDQHTSEEDDDDDDNDNVEEEEEEDDDNVEEEEDDDNVEDEDDDKDVQLENEDLGTNEGDKVSTKDVSKTS